MRTQLAKILLTVFICFSFVPFTFAAEEAKPEIKMKIWKASDLLESDKLVKYLRSFRDTALQPLNPKSNAMKGVLEQATEKNVTDLYISFEGEKNETNSWGMKGVYYVVAAVEITFIEPTRDNIEKIIKESTPGSLEYKSALLFAKKDPASKEIAEKILDNLKKANKYSKRTDDYIKITVEYYASLLGKEAIPELTKLLKYHELDKVRLESGKMLVKLGAPNEVEEAMKNEKVRFIKDTFRKELMK